MHIVIATHLRAALIMGCLMDITRVHGHEEGREHPVDIVNMPHVRPVTAPCVQTLDIDNDGVYGEHQKKQLSDVGLHVRFV